MAVIAAEPPAELDVGDVVEVSGTIVQVQRVTFDEDFGVAANELLEDPDGFFEQEEGDVAISANRVEILEEQAED